MRSFFLIWVALLTASCGPSRDICRGLGSPPGASFDDDLAQRAIDDPEEAEEQFLLREYLADNRIDPSRADVETLLSIPGFPEELARRVVASANGRSGNGAWIERLTPEEREDLYCYRDYLVLPSRHPVHMTCRFTDSRLSEPGSEVREGFLSLSAFDVKALWRGKLSNAGTGAAYYFSAGALADALRLHAGTFVPDFARGLVFGGSCGSYLFSSAYPFRRPRGIAGSTSFSSRTMLGSAAELDLRRIYGAVFVGMPRTCKSGTFELEDRAVLGGRLEVRRGHGAFGLSVSTPLAGPDERLYGADARYASDRVNAGFELAFAETGEPALISALSCRSSEGHAGLFSYVVPAGRRGVFGNIGGRTPGAATAARGVTATAEREIVPGFVIRGAIDRYVRTDVLDENGTRSSRVECERRWNRLTLRVTRTDADKEHLDLVPYPGEGANERARSNSLGVFCEARSRRTASVGVT
ncbi:MAG TPA: hypothetical protein VMT60_02875, partial [Candidatus Bathyarchaeia archaeon]|nr:hypothetical protein [Candidatus Bathyarchaeia archaeon]